jgi:hypothetical protein
MEHVKMAHLLFFGILSIGKRGLRGTHVEMSGVGR